MFAYPSTGPTTATTDNFPIWTIWASDSSAAAPTVTTNWVPGPDAAETFAKVFFRRTGQIVPASLLRDSFGRWNALAHALQAQLTALDARDRALRCIARHIRLSRPRTRVPRRRVRTCGMGSSRSARPPEAL